MKADHHAVTKAEFGYCPADRPCDVCEDERERYVQKLEVIETLAANICNSRDRLDEDDAVTLLRDWWDKHRA